MLLSIFLTPCISQAEEFLYILNDKCINDLYNLASSYFNRTEIEVIRDARGIILRIKIVDSNTDKYNEIKKIEYFLAKIENPAIIEVHMGNFPKEELNNLKKWEVSTVIANKIEAIITKPEGVIPQNRINSVGYGEFLPAKNTPNNGGNYLNRIDIIILCNISGE